jgi:uncharacterized protein YdaU (DUF1376 family)
LGVATQLKREVSPPAAVSFLGELEHETAMHYYQFNIGDYHSHTLHLSEIEDLTYRRLLDWYYLHETPIPLDESEVSRQIRMRSHTESIAIVLREYFECTDDGWIHHRANKEIAKAGDKSEKASASAKARWSKKDANALPPLSESNTTHNTVHITQDTEHKTQKKATVVACPLDVRDQVWNDWVALRKSKKAPITATVVEGARKEAFKLNWPLDKFLVEWCTRGSQGLKAEWVVKPNPADNVRLTVAPSNEPDPALEKIKQDEKITRPPTPEERAILNAYRKKA